MRRLISAGATDVGRARKNNEDSILLLDGVYAVADGVGGHRAGEVASQAALEPIRELEGRVFADDSAASAALHDAAVDANRVVRELADKEPAYQGMGTTLTAAMLEGRRLHLAHVGDSRAYLLRDGQFSQITDDHTLVQHLIDEGHITREEADRHPQRNIVTRAVGVAPDVEVDSLSLDLQPGDQLLLCTDGLTGVVADAAIADHLTNGSEPDDVISALIDQANAAGGPDNITVLLLRFEDSDADAVERAETQEPANRTISITTRTESEDDDWAGRLGTYGSLTRGGPNQQGEDDDRRPGRILGRATAIVLALGLLVGLVIGGGQFLLSRSYFVGLDGDEVVIFQGIDADIGPLSLARVRERTELTLDDIPTWFQPQLEAGRPAANLNDARRIVRSVPLREAEDEPEDEPADDPDADPDADAEGEADGAATGAAS